MFMFSHCSPTKMNIVIFALFVPFVSGSLTVDWPVDPEITNALKVTKDLLDAGQIAQQRMLFVTLEGSDLDLNTYFLHLPATASVSIMSWETLLHFSKYRSIEHLFRFQFQLIVMIMYPNLEMLPKVDGYLFNFLGLRSSCKVIVIMPDFAKRSALVIEKVEISFLKKHSVLFLFSESAALYEFGASNLEIVTDKLHQNDRIFVPRKKFDGKVLKVAHMDDPPRSKVVDGRVVGLDGLFLDGYVKYMNTSYVVELHFEQRDVTYEYHYQFSLVQLLMFNIFEFGDAPTQLSYMFHMFGPTQQCLLVPKQPTIRWMDRFLKILQPSFITLLLMMFMVLGLVLYLVLRTHPKLKLGLFEIYFTLFQIAITNSVHRSKMRTQFERISLLACIFLCFLIVSAVQSLLKKFLLFPISEDIDTLDQLILSNLTIITTAYNFLTLRESHGASFANNHHAVENPFTEKINRSFAYMLNKEEVDRFYYSNENFVDGVQQMHRMKECFVGHYRGYISPMDSYYMESMHFYLQAIEESGIRQHWEKRQFDEDNMKRQLVGEDLAITVVDMEKVFKLLFIGYIAATLAFLVELFIGHIMRRRSRAK